MAKRSLKPKLPVLHVVNEGQAPTLFSNHCELALIADEFRIIFREVLSAEPDKLVVRENLRVYFNINVARQFTQMFKEAVALYDAKVAARRGPDAD